MNLDNIPEIRKKFEAMREKMKMAWKRYDANNYDAWHIEFIKIRTEEENMCLEMYYPYLA
jgi:hypothetical protein